MALLDRSPHSPVPPVARAFGAAWITLVLHVAVVVALTWWVRRESNDEPPLRTAESIRTDLVWLERPGLLRGGGRGGDGQKEPAVSAQRPGQSRITMPARVPRSFTGSSERTPRLQEIIVPVMPEASGLHEVPGVVSTLALVDSGTSQGPGTGPGSGDGLRGSGLGNGRDSNTGDGPAGTGSGVRPPELLVQVRPNYTSAAMMARIQGVVGMEAVVMPDGSVGEVRIIRSLDQNLGLDEQAIKAVKRWRFRPATRLGTAIPMFVSIEMTFSLR